MANNSAVNIVNLHGVSFEINDDVNRNYELTGLGEDNQTFKLILINTNTSSGVFFNMTTNLQNDNIATFFNKNVPPMAAKTLEFQVINQSLRLISAGETELQA